MKVEVLTTLMFILQKYSAAAKTTLKHKIKIYCLLSDYADAAFQILRKSAFFNKSVIVDVTGFEFVKINHEHLQVGTTFRLHEVNTEIAVLQTKGPHNPFHLASTTFPGATWGEREAFEMYGVLPNNSPEYRTLLLDYGYCWAPLRKIYPAIGISEIDFDSRRNTLRLGSLKSRDNLQI